MGCSSRSSRAAIFRAPRLTRLRSFTWHMRSTTRSKSLEPSWADFSSAKDGLGIVGITSDELLTKFIKLYQISLLVDFGWWGIDQPYFLLSQPRFFFTVELGTCVFPVCRSCGTPSAMSPQYYNASSFGPVSRIWWLNSRHLQTRPVMNSQGKKHRKDVKHARKQIWFVGHMVSALLWQPQNQCQSVAEPP